MSRIDEFLEKVKLSSPEFKLALIEDLLETNHNYAADKKNAILSQGVPDTEKLIEIAYLTGYCVALESIRDASFIHNPRTFL